MGSHVSQYYDPRVWVREGEKTLSARVKEACADLGNVSKYRLDLWKPTSFNFIVD